MRASATADASEVGSPMEVTYLGNEGFLIRSGTQAVLFDALFGAGLPDYDHVPAKIIADMETGKPPFDKIDVILISHVHPDHFDVASTVRFLSSHPATVVVAPTEVSQRLQKAVAGNRQMLSQIRALSTERGRLIMRNEGGLPIGAFPLTHGKVENLAYLVVFKGRAVLHLGDADLPMNDLAQLKLTDRRIALAFIPFWQLTENAEGVRDQIGARIVVPMHLITHPTTASSKGYMKHVGGSAGMLAKIRAEFPNAAVFRKPLETKTF